MEEFRRFNEAFEVSDQGNLKKNGVPIKPCAGKKYDYVTYKGKMLRVHEMVGQIFPEICGENDERLHLHHINGDSKDNRAVNLVKISPEDHRRLHQEENEVSVPVKAYDMDGNYVGRWDSKTQAAKATGVDYRHISEMVNGTVGRYSAGGYVWFKEDVTEEEVSEKLQPVMERAFKRKAREEQAKEKETIRRARIERRKRQIEENLDGKKILEYDEFGNLLRIWDNTYEIVKYYKVAYSTISKNISGKTEFVKKLGRKRYFVRKKHMPS